MQCTSLEEEDFAVFIPILKCMGVIVKYIFVNIEVFLFFWNLRDMRRFIIVGWKSSAN